MKNFIFLVGTTNNSELGSPRPSWIDKILLPHLCIVCFITFLAIYQGKFGFWKFSTKTWTSVKPLPPLLGQMPNFFRKTILMAPLIVSHLKYKMQTIFIWTFLLGALFSDCYCLVSKYQNMLNWLVLKVIVSIRYKIWWWIWDWRKGSMWDILL